MSLNWMISNFFSASDQSWRNRANCQTSVLWNTRTRIWKNMWQNWTEFLQCSSRHNRCSRNNFRCASIVMVWQHIQVWLVYWKLCGWWIALLFTSGFSPIRFRKRIRDIEIIIDNLVAAAFETVQNIEEGIDVLWATYQYAKRPNLKDLFEKKTYQVLTSILFIDFESQCFDS